MKILGLEIGSVRMSDKQFANALHQLYMRAEVGRKSEFRCCQCRTMQPVGSTLIWVDDGVLKGDPLWSVRNKNQAGQWNGERSGWCRGCVENLIEKGGDMPKEIRPPAPPVKKTPRRPQDGKEYKLNATEDEWIFDEAATQDREENLKRRLKQENEKRELRRALVTRPLSSEELVRVGKEGWELFVNYHHRGNSGFSESYSKSEKMLEFNNALLMQSCLQQAAKRDQSDSKDSN